VLHDVERTLTPMPVDAALRAELLAMLEEHRAAAALAHDDPALVDARRTVDHRHADRIWTVLDDYEVWPGRRLVGDDGAQAAWLIVQDAIEDPGLQRRSLELLEVAVDNGDADPQHSALLLDRVRMADGLPQLYGSQFVVGRTGDLEPWPIDDLTAVEERRRKLGFPPFADHAAEMRARWRQRTEQSP
jgi:hypothetical protein